MKFAWIERHQDQFEVQAMCDVLGVSKSGYHAFRGRGVSVRGRRRQELKDQIRRAHTRSRETYGSPRIAVELKEAGVSICQNTVAKYMREEGLRCVSHRRFRVLTTDSNHDYPIAANMLDRQFQSPRPDRTWCVDITYVPTGEGFLYLAAVIDLCSRRIVGWSMADHLRAELCVEALSMAAQRRDPGSGLLHHSDRGVQYACGAYRSFMEHLGMQASMSRTGNCYDNAVMESFFSTLKRELIHRHRYATRAEARLSIFEYIEVFYNRQRRHSAIGYKSPEAFEASLN